MRCIAVLILLAAAAPAQEKLPPLLEQALRRLPGVTVRDASIPFPEDITSVQELTQDGRWPPWRVLDLDGDKRGDVVAVVTSRTGEYLQFGVLAIHAKTPSQALWIAKLGDEQIYSVIVDDPPGSVTPLFCYHCDALAFYRWGGQEYEPWLHTPGESIRLYDSDRMVRVFAGPSPAGNVAAEVPSCTTAKVVEVRGTSPQTRWYLIETQTPKKIRGWVPASVNDGTECMG